MRIGAFDSGIGGLTALAPLFSSEKDLDVVFFGDRANLPYGTKSATVIRELVKNNLQWLFKTHGQQKPFDLLIVACNTASAHALDVATEIGKAHNTPVLGVIEPGCRAALKQKPSRIVVLATSATVSCGAYLDNLKILGCQVPVIQKACPLFVPFVEEGYFEGPGLEWVCNDYLKNILRPGDAVILGCTHYPFLIPLLSKLFSHQNWIDAGASLKEDSEIKKIMARSTPEAAQGQNLKLIFTDNALDKNFLTRTLSFLQLNKVPLSVEFVKI